MDHTNIPMQQHRQINGGEGAEGNVGVGGRSGGGGGGADGASVLVCRPSGTRWTPTSEQIRILRDLYYNCGIRSPNSEQIQRIAAMLRQYGRIEGKNVFYWFQNHKARERQKKRLTTLDVNTSSLDVNTSSLSAADVNHLGALSLSPSGAAAPSSPGLYAGNGASAVQQLEASTNCWDSTAMATERSFLQDYMGVSSSGAEVAPTLWAARFSSDQRAMATREPETLPLFPTGGSNHPRHVGPGESGQESIVHGSHLSNFQCWSAAAAATATTITIQQHQLLQLQEQHSFYSSNQLPNQDAVPPPPPAAAAAGTSLELTLSSYCSPYPAGSM